LIEVVEDDAEASDDDRQNVQIQSNVDNRIYGRDSNGLYKNHAAYVQLKNQVNEHEEKNHQIFESINAKLQDS